MKHTTSTLCVAVACAIGVSVGAQSRTAAPPNTSQPAATERETGEITVSGCLRRGDDGKFVVANVDQDDRGINQPGATDKPGNAPTAPPPSKVVKNWWLEGGAALDKHVGHRIQVTGTVATDQTDAPPSMSSGADAAARGTAGASGTMGDVKDSAHGAGRLNVKAVKPLTGGCL